MSKENAVYVTHILERINRIQSFIDGKELDEFYESLILQDAIVRNFEVMGEATKNLTPEFRALHSHIPWKSIAGMRDVLIHDYVKVDVMAVWLTIGDELPTLKANILELLESLK